MKKDLNNKAKIKKHLQKGRFYHIHEGSPTGHPGMIFWKNDKRNLYLTLTTDSSVGNHRTKLSKPTNKETNQSYVYNRPTLAKRRDVGGRYIDMVFSKKDRIVLRIISTKKYRESGSIRSKDRRYMKKLKKKPRY